MSRFTETTSEGSALEDSSLEYRFIWWRTTSDWLRDGARLVGVGFPSAAQDARVTDIQSMAPDSMWVPVLWSLGLIGVVGIAGMFGAFLWRAASLILTTEGDAAVLSTVLLGWMVAVVLLGLREWVIYDPWHTPLALSFFALLTAEVHRRRVEVHKVSTASGEGGRALAGVVGSRFG